MINDEYIIDYFYGTKSFIKRNHLKEFSSEIEEYLLNRYNDSESIFETIFRIKHKIDNRPVCPICSNPVKFIGKNSQWYQTFCCRSCLSKHNVEIIKEKYGVNSTLELQDIKEKSKNTLNEKYGVSHNWEIKEVHEQCIKTTNENYSKEEINDKRKKTCMKHFGVKHHMQLQKYQNLISSKNYMKSNNNEKIKTAQLKRYDTLKENNTFNSSTIEDKLIQYFDECCINYKYQYKSSSYSCMCDFYFPDVDLYCEIQGNWTHGGKPYEGTSQDIEKLNIWKEKAIISKYYKNAINVWTISDVEKRNKAKENNLNYLEIFSIDFEECKTKIMEHLNVP